MPQEIVPTPQPGAQTGSGTVGTIGTQAPAAPAPNPGSVFPNLHDWQAALALYLVCLWLAETEALAPIAVTLAWGTAVVYFFAKNPVGEIISSQKKAA